MQADPPWVLKGARFLRSLKGSGRRAVLVVEGGEAEALHMEGFDPGDQAAEAFFLSLCERVLGCPASLLVLDARLEDQPPAGPRSALCLPARGPQGQLSALLYADSDRAGAFSHQDLARAERFAEVWLSPETPRQLPHPSRGLPAAALACLVAAIIWGLGGMALMSSPPPPPRPTPDLVRAASPEASAGMLISQIQGRDLDATYQFLSGPRRDEMSLQVWRESLSRWLEDPTHRWDLDARAPESATSSDTSAEVKVGSQHQGQPVWTWTMSREEGGWKLAGWDQGPFPRPHQSRS